MRKDFDLLLIKTAISDDRPLLLGMIKIDGKKIAQDIIFELKSGKLPNKFLAVFLVGDNPASESFVKQKEKIAKELGIDFRIYKFGGDLSSDKLKEKMSQIISSKLCGGAVLQLPLPAGLNPLYVMNVIPPEKDVDVLSERSLGGFYNGRSKILPPSVAAVVEIFKYLNIKINTIKSVAVVGQGNLVGKPITSWLSGKIPQVAIFDKGSDLTNLKEADVVILGAGVCGLVKAPMLKRGAGVIDFGYGQKQIANNKWQVGGDFDDDSIAETGESYLSFYTPTPGGTGPVLVACLLKNFFEINRE
jgi:methylenetetrahydrofolate dehydrogenase (NADP+)/methenyltetrahydrofolate cyclohydrolase